jgi:hypothetical protein
VPFDGRTDWARLGVPGDICLRPLIVRQEQIRPAVGSVHHVDPEYRALHAAGDPGNAELQVASNGWLPINAQLSLQPEDLS